MIKSKLMIVPLLAALAVPASVSAGERVEFAFKASELSTPAKRELLLVRLEKESRKACRGATTLPSADWLNSCAGDLRDQFVRAIDDEALTQLVEASETATYRSAAR